MSPLILVISSVLVAADPAPVDFDNQLIPVLTKAGCNSGACHGAAIGRGGFRLSLYGGDPEFDYRSIALESEGRRVNLARPDVSIVVLKPTETIEHGGGVRLDDDGSGAELLRRWIREGATRFSTKSLVGFDVSPKVHIADDVGAELQLRATAKFNDGSTVDVTPWTVFTPEDAAAVEIDQQAATAKLLRRGRHIVVARYLDRNIPVEIIAPLSDAAVRLQGEPRRNFIDDHVLGLLETLRLPTSPLANDATFLRRVTLDLTGRLPTPAQQRRFQQGDDAKKRDAVVDELLASDEFNEYWTMQLAKLLRIRSQRGGEKEAAQTYHRWLREQLAKRLPYDELARRMLLSAGDTHEVGPANFYRTVGGPREQAEFTSELFMGNRLRCANCHNHPLDRWTQDDYHGLAAVFAKMSRGRVIEVTSRGEVTHPRTGERAVPRIPGERFIGEDRDGRAALAKWLTDRDNPYFAKAIVNRLWKELMGRGLVEPTDDLRATNPATHPALLDELALDFVRHKYDLRHTLRRIARSSTYARSSQTTTANQADDRYYSHALTRPLQPEILADAISDVTGIADRYGDEPLGTRAVSLFDPRIESAALDILGRCSREDSCESADMTAGGLSLKLHLFNGPLLNRRIADPQSRLAKLIAADKQPGEIVGEFYRLAFNRDPTNGEREFWIRQFAGEERLKERRQALEDFVWSLLSCREFVTNH